MDRKVEIIQRRTGKPEENFLSQLAHPNSHMVRMDVKLRLAT
jgi:hypothetical protein